MHVYVHFVLRKNENDIEIKYCHSFCDGDVDVHRLKAEVHMVYDFFQSVIDMNQLKIKQITKISIICEILNSYNVGKQMFREFDKLIKLLTLPVTTTTTTAERAFTILNRLKSTLRTLMTHRTTIDDAPYKRGEVIDSAIENEGQQ